MHILRALKYPGDCRWCCFFYKITFFPQSLVIFKIHSSFQYETFWIGGKSYLVYWMVTSKSIFFFYNLLLLSCQSRMPFPLNTWNRVGMRGSIFVLLCVSRLRSPFYSMWSFLWGLSSLSLLHSFSWCLTTAASFTWDGQRLLTQWCSWSKSCLLIQTPWDFFVSMVKFLIWVQKCWRKW